MSSIVLYPWALGRFWASKFFNTLFSAFLFTSPYDWSNISSIMPILGIKYYIDIMCINIDTENSNETMV